MATQHQSMAAQANSNEANQLLKRMRYKKKLANKPYEHSHYVESLDFTFYWSNANAVTQANYAAELIANNYAGLYPKMIYFRALDSKGNRLFNDAKQYQELVHSTDMQLIMELGNAMVESDAQSSPDKLEGEAVKNSETTQS